jgi:hypothetical protein
LGVHDLTACGKILNAPATAAEFERINVADPELPEEMQGLNFSSGPETATRSDDRKKMRELRSPPIESTYSEMCSENPVQGYVSADWIKSDPEFLKPKHATRPAAAAEKKATSLISLPLFQLIHYVDFSSGSGIFGAAYLMSPKCLFRRSCCRQIDLKALKTAEIPCWTPLSPTIRSISKIQLGCTII